MRFLSWLFPAKKPISQSTQPDYFLEVRLARQWLEEDGTVLLIKEEGHPVLTMLRVCHVEDQVIASLKEGYKLKPKIRILESHDTICGQRVCGCQECDCHKDVHEYGCDCGCHVFCDCRVCFFAQIGLIIFMPKTRPGEVVPNGCGYDGVRKIYIVNGRAVPVEDYKKALHHHFDKITEARLEEERQKVDLKPFLDITSKLEPVLVPLPDKEYSHKKDMI